VKEATRRKVPISNTPGVLTDATAEMAWTLLFAAARRVIEADAHMRSGKWGGWGPMQFLGGDVTGKTLGIVGAGRIGRAVARKSRGFDMDIIYSDVERSEEMEKEYGARKVEFEQLLAQSDFISVHVPLMDQTRHLFDREAFSKMKSSAYLINTSRGPVIEEGDLLEALRSGEIAGAGLDVYEFEPKMTEGLEKLDNVVVTPHIASATTYARTQMGVKAARNLIAMIEGTEPPDCVNPEVMR
jgi:glyoxylate reductase